MDQRLFASESLSIAPGQISRRAKQARLAYSAFSVSTSSPPMASQTRWAPGRAPILDLIIERFEQGTLAG